MTVRIPAALLQQINAHCEAAYPEEGAGFLLGRLQGDERVVTDILGLPNAREDEARRNRYLLSARDVAQAEDEADRRGLSLLGVFHSHPDCPNTPSEFDRQWAMPWFSYLIMRVDKGRTTSWLSWRLSDDRSRFDEEALIVEETEG
ncbi:MAG: M67 family peptidase [Anaerolineae bacterium]|nr:MAG: M67 family peptidase [Anaerolineae bacterium]